MKRHVCVITACLFAAAIACALTPSSSWEPIPEGGFSSAEAFLQWLTGRSEDPGFVSNGHFEDPEPDDDWNAYSTSEGRTLQVDSDAGDDDCSCVILSQTSHGEVDLKISHEEISTDFAADRWINLTFDAKMSSGSDDYAVVALQISPGGLIGGALTHSTDWKTYTISIWSDNASPEVTTVSFAAIEKTSGDGEADLDFYIDNVRVTQSESKPPQDSLDPNIGPQPPWQTAIFNRDDPLIEAINPSQMTVTVGSLNSGSVSDLETDNGVYVKIDPVAIPPCYDCPRAALEISGSTSCIYKLQSDSGGEFDLTVDSSSTGGTIEEKWLLYNYSTSSWDVVKTRNLSSTDDSDTFEEESDPNDYVDPLKGDVKARLEWRQISFDENDWPVQVDLVQWDLTQETG